VTEKNRAWPWLLCVFVLLGFVGSLLFAPALPVQGSSASLKALAGKGDVSRTVLPRSQLFGKDAPRSRSTTLRLLRSPLRQPSPRKSSKAL
jgi:hypothetical protein